MFVFGFGEKHEGSQVCLVWAGAGLGFWQSPWDHVCSHGQLETVFVLTLGQQEQQWLPAVPWGGVRSQL